MKPLTDFCGSKYYPALPSGWKVAQLEDFYDKGRLILKKPFLIHTWHSKVFECHRTQSWFPINECMDIRIWLDQNRIYVLDD